MPPANHATLHRWGVRFFDLGSAKQTFSIDIPEGTLGFHVSAGSWGEVNVEQLEAPDGTRFVTDAVPLGYPQAYASCFAGAPFSSPTLRVPAGRWKVMLDRVASARLALQGTADGAFHGGRMDLHLYLPAGLRVCEYRPLPADGVSAATAADNPLLGRAVDAFFALLWRLTGIGRGTVHYHDVDASLRVIDDADEVEQAWAVSQLNPRRVGLHVLLTEAAFGMRGIAPIFGEFEPGYARSGIVLQACGAAPDNPLYPTEADVDWLRSWVVSTGIDQADAMAYSMLHEAGHLWGLAHTSAPGNASDGDGGHIIWDGFDDTPRCELPAGQALDQRCEDHPNLMFHTQLVPSPQTRLSPQQARVIRAATGYQPLLHVTDR